MKLLSRTRTCDTKCFDLAEYFLSDGSGEANFTHEEAMDLACDIQDAVEGWFVLRKDKEEEDQLQWQGGRHLP